MPYLRAAKPNRAGSKSAPDRQLSEPQRRLLAWLLDAETRLQSKGADDLLELRNRGIPWEATQAATALDVLPASVTRALGRLEDRRLVACWATGEGRGRRVSHVKLSAQAVDVATFQKEQGRSQSQAERAHAKGRREWQQEREDAWMGYQDEST